MFTFNLIIGAYTELRFLVLVKIVVFSVGRIGVSLRTLQKIEEINRSLNNI